MRILIVEDIARDRGLLRMYLEKMKHTVIEAGNGIEALALARQEKPELIISDALMPEMDGFELLRACKEDEVLWGIPFIFYSATYTEEREKQLAAELGAEAFLVKPMEPEAFIAALGKILAERPVSPPPPAPVALEKNRFYEKYARLVATKLEKKVVALEQEMSLRRQAERKVGKNQLRAEKLLEISRISLGSEKEFYNRVLASALELTDSPIGYLFFYDETIRRFTLHAWSREIMDSCSINEEQMIFELDKTGLWGEAVRQRKAIVTNDYSACNPLKKGLPEGHAPLVRHYNLPVFDDDRIVAVLGVGNKQEAYDTVDEEQLQLFADGAWRIIARRLAERAMMESESRYRNLFYESLDGVYRLDGEYRIKSCNPAFAKIFGYESPEELVGGDAGNHWEDQADRQLYHDALTKAKKLKAYPALLLNRNGGPIHAEISSRILEDAGGKFLGIEGILRDVSERAAREQQVRKARDDWERTFNALSDIITIQDKAYRILRCNEAACRLLNKTPDEIIGRRCFEIFWEQTEPCEGCPLAETFSDANVHEAEITKEGGKKIFLISTTPIVYDNGEIEQVIHVATDITRQRKTEQQLRHAQKMESIGTLAGGIAHDFNNILSAILGYADLIRADIQRTGKSTEDIEQVLLAGKRATDLVRQILTFSRQGEQKLQPLSMQFIASEALKLLRPSLPATIEIRQEIDKDCGEILADPSQIHQVVMNLCTNAYQAIGEKVGTIEISLAQAVLRKGDAVLSETMSEGEYVLFTVSDTGSGMDLDTMEKIFEPYFSTKKEKGGTGLGLAMVHGIVDGLGGKISVYSEPGQGTTFKVYFPVINGHIESQADEKRDKDAPLVGSERLLVVDDEKPLVDLAKRMLESLGYQVTGIVGSAEALTVFMERPDDFDLLITDLSMPCMDGVELSRKTLEQRPDLPIILISGFGDSAKRKKAEAAGIRDFIMKPVTRMDLAKVVRKVLGKT
jgi:PAS domain S-box-containing protein